jgi:hypothetical protein
MCGVRDDTPLDELCDSLIYVLAEGAPGEQLKKLRDQVQIASWKVQPPDRSTWGLSPEQRAAQERLMRAASGA